MLCQGGRYYSLLQQRADDKNDYYFLFGMWSRSAINLSVFFLAAISFPISGISNGMH